MVCHIPESTVYVAFVEDESGFYIEGGIVFCGAHHIHYCGAHHPFLEHLVVLVLKAVCVPVGGLRIGSGVRLAQLHHGDGVFPGREPFSAGFCLRPLEVVPFPGVGFRHRQQQASELPAFLNPFILGTVGARAVCGFQPPGVFGIVVCAKYLRRQFFLSVSVQYVAGLDIISGFDIYLGHEEVDFRLFLRVCRIRPCSLEVINGGIPAVCPVKVGKTHADVMFLLVVGLL